MSQRRPPITHPHLSILQASFDSTVNTASQKKTATGEAGRPKDIAMEQVITGQSKRNASEDADNSEAIRRAERWLESRMVLARSEVFSENVHITPEIAKVLLARNPNNRKIKIRSLQPLKADIANGAWAFNGESIIISRDGLLNDGQHRLTACVETGVSIQSVVVFGVDREARTTTDQGGARGAGDYLSMRGMSEGANVVAAVSRLLWQFKKYGALFDQRNMARQPTKAEIVVVAEANPDIAKSLIAVRTKDAKLLNCSLSLLAFMHFILSERDQDAAQTFMSRLIGGFGFEENSPINAARSKLMRDNRWTQVEKYEILVRAWNAYRAGRPLSKLQINGNSPKVAR